MNGKFKSALLAIALLGASWTNAANAQAVNRTINAIYADPSDFVLVLSGDPGPCGSHYFHFKRSSANFKEAVAVALTAFSMAKIVTVYTTGPCPTDRNDASHIGAFN